ncbi:mannose-6-phosphate isomerase, class I [Microlunatus elymi]|uniref:mannose-6-phosphate isomerase n=1 Tax=Microlunatus elymi TaxID=2596828 RepID=A0A516Q4J7_9ACTN|nr:mannose-6-phosphate isomerase, class I [Microlunatus elymi]QDP98141.1 mannose-6-phosphate isomerase, class I [Microlunatus elymi]
MKRLTGKIQPYAWGSKSAIPKLIGTEPSGEPQAELWLGAHPLAPSLLVDHGGAGEGLDAAIEADPQSWVGKAPVQEFGPRLPYLMKVLAAAQPLSLQAHPNRQQAEEGFAREEAAGIARNAPERTYRDDWPKPEALCALGEFHALCGFREPAETYRLFEELEVPAALQLVAPLKGGGPAELKQVFGDLLRMRHAGDLVDHVVRAAMAWAAETGPTGRFARTAVEVAGFYPGDPGVLAALLMNRVILNRHQALFLPAGNLHAYLRGLGVEIMANSDNVLRGGLTGKHIDVDELLKLLDFTPGAARPVPTVENSPGVVRYQTPAPEFALWRLDVDHEPDAGLTLPADDLGRVALSTDGSVSLHTQDSTLHIGQGQAAFLRPGEQVTVSGDGTVFVGSAGSSAS